MRFPFYLKTLSLFTLLSISIVVGSFAQSEPSIIDLRKGVHQKANDYRESLKLNRLVAKSGLNKLAQRHALNMASGKVPFSHNGFDNRYEDAKAYFNRPISMAENLYFSNYDAEQIASGAVKGWIKSPGHHRNLKGSFEYTGIGVAKNEKGEFYVVQLYAK